MVGEVWIGRGVELFLRKLHDQHAEAVKLSGVTSSRNGDQNYPLQHFT